MQTLESRETRPIHIRAGAALNSGPVPKRERFANVALRVRKRVTDHLPDILDGIIYLARGEYLDQQDDTTGETVRVYTRQPDLQAAICLVRLLDMPRQTNAPEAYEACLSS